MRNILIGVPLFILMIVYVFMSWAFVASHYYNWFILEITNYPLTFLNIVCIMLFLNVIRPKLGRTKNFKNTNKDLAIFFFSPWILLVIGYLFSLFI